MFGLNKSRSAFVAIGFYKMVWIFLFCCVLGFCVETLWCYLRHGYIESRKSLVYGPLSVAYGMGGVLLTALLYHFTTSNRITIFVISFIAGTVAEYICSLGQEICFGTVAWDYSHLPLNINGRVCLIYSFFWGFLGLFWVKVFLPLVLNMLQKIPLNISRVVIWAFVVFFIFDCAMSAGAAVRMGQREKNKPASNFVDAFFDERFPDERMHKIYANSQKVEK